MSGFDKQKWDAKKSGIVEEGNWWKFAGGKDVEGGDLGKRLVETGGRELVEVGLCSFLLEVGGVLGGWWGEWWGKRGWGKRGNGMGIRALTFWQASPRDSIWGIGFAAENAEEMRAEWGENLLGKALMRVRERLREEGEGKGNGNGEGL